MKAPHVIAKNLKLLFRSKESAFTIIFGPLLIILLVSAAYIGGDVGSQLSIGVTMADTIPSPLAQQIITSLKDQNYLVNILPNQTVCKDMIKSGELHACIFLPQDFRIKQNETKEVVFAVDYSRINLVYQIIEGLNKEIGVQRSAIGTQLTDTLLQRVTVAQKDIEEQRGVAESMDSHLTSSLSEISQGRAALESVDVNVSFVDLLEIKGRVSGLSSLVTGVKESGQSAINDSIETLRDVRSDVENETLDEVDSTIQFLQNRSDDIDRISNDAPRAVEEVGSLIDQAALAMKEVEVRFGELVNASQDADARLSTSREDLVSLSKQLTTLRGTLASADDSLKEALKANSGGLISPIVTRIEQINGNDSDLTFTYPYILMLVIMFLGLMLGSTLIVKDKTSKAAFRNFTTATRDEYGILLSFITTFLVLMVQVCAIILLSYFFVKTPLFANFGVTFIIISFAITIFSFLGMIIGYLARTQEAAMISSLTIGSIFLFISNLVIPLEAMNRVVKTLSVYNPYVVLSELLKSSMLYGLKLSNIPQKLGLLVATVLVLFFTILGVQRSFKARYFRKQSKDLAVSAFAQKTHVIKPLILEKRKIKDLFDLLEALDAMTRSEFEELITSNKNPLADWVRKEVRDRSLARRLNTRSKERMILALDKYLKRATKRLAKKK